MTRLIIPNVLYHYATNVISRFTDREVISSVSQWIRGKTRMKRMGKIRTVEKKLKKLPKKIDFFISTDYL